MSWPACAICTKPATCYGLYEGDELDKPCYACDECCDHGNEDGWCRPVEAEPEPPPNEESPEEPGPKKGDLLCGCGCTGPAFYTCYVGQEDGVLACARLMRELADDARLFGERFKAVPFPKPLAYSMLDYVRGLPQT
jgi:hypothetical protein